MFTIIKIQLRNYNLPLSFIWVSKNIINARYIILFFVLLLHHAFIFIYKSKGKGKIEEKELIENASLIARL